MALSSTTLFHFTKNFDTLVAILKDGLWPRFCIERDWGDKDLAIPMICTCDIPLSEMKFHMKKYGSYGIGINKGWAKENNFIPILYVSDKSDVFNRLDSYAKKFLVQPMIMPPTALNEEYLLYFTKRYVGTDADREYYHMSKKPKFSNEREWRYVPMDTVGVHMWFTSKGKGQELDLNRLNNLTKNDKIKIPLDKIEYLVIDREKERHELIKRIKDAFPNESNEKVLSCIISKEKIEDDF